MARGQRKGLQVQNYENWKGKGFQRRNEVERGITKSAGTLEGKDRAVVGGPGQS